MYYIITIEITYQTIQHLKKIPALRSTSSTSRVSNICSMVPADKSTHLRTTKLMRQSVCIALHLGIVLILLKGASR